MVKRCLGSIVLGVCLICVTTSRAGQEPSYQGHPLAYWVDVFKRPKDEQAAKDAKTALVRIGAPAVPVLIEMLRDRGTKLETTDARRLGAAMILGEIGPPARDALAALREAEKDDPFFPVRFEAAAAIKKIGKK